MIRTARQLKDLVRNKSKSDSKKAQSLIRIYCMERFLERLSLSQYKGNFILKGGILVSSMVGTDRRVTMDIDTTIKGKKLSIEDAKSIVNEIIAIHLDDGTEFEILDVYKIMEEAEYTGVRIHMTAWIDRMKTPIKIDISTGDVITPREIKHSYKLMFEEREIELLSYNLITVLAEKVETIISRGAVNTRLRDFYDIFILSDYYCGSIDWKTLSNALAATSRKRGSEELMKDAFIVIKELSADTNMQQQWERYQKKNDYASGISWDAVIERLDSICQNIIPFE